MTPTLVILAGGLGSRFGGDKQLVPVGPGGETFLDLAIVDASRSGMHEVLIVARTNIDDLLVEHLSTQDHSASEIRIVHQDTFGPPRSKPWGTGHAVLCAAMACSGSMVILNADDYYGPSGPGLAATGLASGDGEIAVLVAYNLEETLSENGAVSRGVCDVAAGRLAGLVETHGIHREGEVIRSEEPRGILSPDTPVSMNLWGLPRPVLDRLVRQWSEFHSEHGADATIEFLLPVAVEEQRAAGLVAVDVIRSGEKWMGITNPADLQAVRKAFSDSM